MRWWVWALLGWTAGAWILVIGFAVVMRTLKRRQGRRSDERAPDDDWSVGEDFADGPPPAD